MARYGSGLRVVAFELDVAKRFSTQSSFNGGYNILCVGMAVKLQLYMVLWCTYDGYQIFISILENEIPIYF